MGKLQLSMGVCDYDRTRGLFDGRVQIEGCDVAAVNVEPEEAFHRAFGFQEFDISELSISSHTMMTSRGSNAYVGIPAFVSRLFRHSGVYIRTDRGIDKPQDLAGKTVGLPEYQITANVWIRGILEDDFGVKPSSIHWRRGGVEDPGRLERAPICVPTTPCAPARLSISTCWPSCSDSWGAIARITKSVPPPGGNGTITRSGFTG